jgi:hypothetical protein
MDIETKNNLKLRQQVTNLGNEISGEIEHAECFYDKEMLENFCSSLDMMKNLAREYFISNRKEMEDEE